MIADSADDYRLLDLGHGRKLERFGRFTLDRPAGGAVRPPRTRHLWNTAAARFERGAGAGGSWIPPGALPPRWTVGLAGLRFELRATPFGHVGLFPEHATVWRRVAHFCRQAPPPRRVLNLFAYTGGATLAAAGAGAEVTHVDAAENVVRWARRNAELSALADRPVHWIAEDARRFVDRESRRGRRYDLVVLDPPAFGHSPKGQRWSIDEDLQPLLEACRELLTESGAMALSSHSRGFAAERLRELLAGPSGRTNTEPLTIRAESGATLSCGYLAWSSAALL